MKKIKDLIYKIKESTRLQLIVGAISVGLIATGVVGVIAYKNSNNSIASSGEVEEANESEADIILTENESGELVATDKEGNVVASGEEVEKLVEEKKSKGETVVAKTEDGTTVKVDKVDGDKVTSSGGQTVKPSPKPPVIADKPTDKPSNGGNSDNGSSNKPTDKPSNGGDSNNNNNNNNNNNQNNGGSHSGNGSFGWPCPGYTSVSSGYGYRSDPFSGSSSFHNGIDIPAPAGTPVVAASSGTVEWANLNPTAGNWIGINHGNGVYTIYMHMSALLVSPGTQVSAGQTIGLVGTTGSSTGNHLHFTVRVNGAYQNPYDYLN